MRLDCISDEAWKEFNKRFPQAAAFLLQSSLEGELRLLQSQTNLSRWESKRLAELEKLLAPCDRCGGAGRVEDPDLLESAYITDDGMMPCPECEGG